jgi:Carboxypeptidase regulatory-like domain
MLLVPLLVWAAVADSGSALELGPAPGVSPAEALVLAGQPVALDAEGRGRVAEQTELSAPGLRFYTVGDRAFYYPADFSLMTWPLAGPDRGVAAEIVAKDHDAESWAQSRTSTAPLETADASRRVRFVLAPGRWDLAILVPGFAPAFVSDVAVDGAAAAVELSRLARSALLKGRILDGRSGKAPARWTAWLRRVGTEPETEEARFFEDRPVAVDRPALEFGSLPTGNWELEVVAPGRGRRTTLVQAPRPRMVADVGDFYIAQSGGLRVALAFPSEVPNENFVVRLRRDALDPDGLALELGRKTVTPRAETIVVFEDLEPGPVRLAAESASGGVQRRELATVESGATVDVRLTFVPVRLHGRVRRGELPVSGALIQAGAPGGSEKEISTTSDDLGEYSLRFWAAADQVFLTTLDGERGGTLPFAETVALREGEDDVPHDIQLPGGEIRGSVRDAETGAPISGANVRFSSSSTPEETSEYVLHFEYGDMSDREGRFSLRNLPPNPIDVEVSHDGYSPRKLPAIEPTPEGAELDVRLEKGLRLVGTVRDETGSPVAGATVAMDPDPESYFFTRTTTSTAAGEFQFESLAAGEHLLAVLKCGATLVLRPVTLPPASPEAAEHREDFRLEPELPPIAVHVEDDLGAPIPNMTLQWAVGGIPIPFSDFDRAARGCGRASAPDAEGNLSLRGLPRGPIAALVPAEERVLSTFTNDGSQMLWTIRIPRVPEGEAPNHNPHDATAPPAR